MSGAPSGITSLWQAVRRRPLLGVLLLSFGLRLAWLLYARPYPVSDFEAYLTLAEHIRAHGALPPSAFRLPGLSYFLAAMMLVSRSVAWLSLGTVLLSTALVAVVYGVALRLTGANRGKATYCALACGVNPTFVLFAPLLGSEHLFVLFLFGALWLVLAMETNPRARALLAGGLLGLGIVTRGEGVFYVPSFLLLLWLGVPKRRERAVTSALLLAACAVVVLPWVVRNAVVVGRGAGLSTAGGVNFYYAHNDGGYGWRRPQETALAGLPELEAHRAGYRLGFQHIKEQGTIALGRDVAVGTRLLYAPSPYALAWSLKLPRDGAAEVFPDKHVRGESLLSGFSVLYYIFIIIVAAPGVIFWRRARPLWRWLPVLSIPVLNWLCYAVVFWGKARYRFTAEVVICLVAGITFYALMHGAAIRPRSNDG